MIVSNIAILCCFVPVILLLFRKMRKVTTYRMIGIYWLFNGVINFMNLDLFRHFRNNDLQERLTFYYNILDTPLVLVVFACAVTGRHRQWLLRTLGLFIIGEVGLILWHGYNFTSSTMIIGSGLLLILAYSVIGLVQYMRKMEHTPFENSMVFVYAALLFAYGSFLIIYIFTHLRSSSEGSGRDSFLLYYISLLLSAAVTSLGLWSYGLRHRPQIAI